MLIFVFGVMPTLFASTNVGDITKINGLDDNYVRGVGLVAGLNGKGDKGKAVKEAVRNLHKRLGRAIYSEKDIEARNMAIVILTAKVPPFARRGQKLDVAIAAQGAESLEGGTLVDSFLYLAGVDPTKMSGEFSQAIVVAQGKVLIGNSGQVGKVQGAAANTKASQPTSGTVKGGGIVIKELPTSYVKEVKDVKGNIVGKYFSLLLDRPSFTNAKIIAEEVNEEFILDVKKTVDDAVKVNYAEAITANEVRIEIPSDYHSEVISFIARIEQVRLDSIKSEAKVIVNEKTGNITISGQVLLNECTTAYNDLIFNIAKDSDLAQVLQALSEELKTKDQIAILQQLHKAGHLRAKFEVE